MSPAEKLRGLLAKWPDARSEMPDAMIDALGLVLVNQVDSGASGTLISLTLGCPICPVAAYGPDANLKGVPSTVVDDRFKKAFAANSGYAYNDANPDWALIITCLRDNIGRMLRS